jgi:hypothetical protein
MKNSVVYRLISFTILLLISGLLNAGSLPQFGVEQKPFEPLKKSKAQSLAFVDDFISSPKVNLTFPFLIGGKWYHEVYIHENGFVWFGNEKLNGENIVEPLKATSLQEVEAVISAYGADLQSGIFTKASLLTQVSGTAPLRVFTIEWSGFTRAEALLEGQKENLSFQIRLHEKNGEIEIHYGDFALSAIATTKAQIGISLKSPVMLGAVSEAWINGISMNTPAGKLSVDAKAQPSFGLCYRIYTEMPYIVMKNPEGINEKVAVEELPSVYYKNLIYSPEKGINISQRYLAMHQLSLAKSGQKQTNGKALPEQSRLSQLISSVRWRTN